MPLSASPLTAVQLQESPRCELVAGDPLATPVGRRGPVALFAPGELVAYAVHGGLRPRLFLFRTRARDGAAATAVPGVHPRVELLLALESARVLRRTRRFFSVLRRQNRPASSLPDSFYVRLDRILRARGPLVPLTQALLASVRIHSHTNTNNHRP
jgi:hypothetical protein